MIPIEIKTRIVFLLAVYLLEDIGLHLSSLLLPYYLDDEEQPSADEMVNLATQFLEQAMKEYE
ncbi:hypothetical protein HW423_10605 [Aerococcaceae bacterium INB8]|uniref:Uncharacterized protein n=1 Tax=Ruoffia halotolerans TaxID=2748684 RepID=A0A839A8V8_9LACT|nr:hypothetical protein [Ruoffia halotolerans]MBA5730230.1 hypothetical protein [Ruoffia halotolerans]